MATHRKSIMGFGTKPDTSGECFFEPYSIVATNDVWDRMVCRFGASNAAQPTVRHGFHGGFIVPQNYVGTAAIIIVWTASIITGDVVWDFDYRTVGGNDTTSLDQAGTEQALTVTDTAPGAANRRLEATISPTAANFSAGEEVEFFFARDGADAADTMAGAALLFSLSFQYADA